MSGLEAIGIVASVVQIADFGGRLSVKLCTFGHKIKHADRNISNISNDVALTCNVLRELGDNFKKDEQTKLCNNNAIATAEKVIAECKKVFTDLESALDEDLGKGVLKRLGRGIKFSLVEPQIELLRSNLERLKSTLLLMLNVIIYAEQLRDKEKNPVLQEQRELIKTLKEEKKDNDRKFDQLAQAIEGLATSKDATLQVAQHVAQQQYKNHPFQINMVHVPEPSAQSGDAGQRPRMATHGEDSRLQSFEGGELDHYCALVRALLKEIEETQYKIDHHTRTTFREGLHHSHEKATHTLLSKHGYDKVYKAFGQGLKRSSGGGIATQGQDDTAIGEAAEHGQGVVSIDDVYKFELAPALSGPASGLENTEAQEGISVDPESPSKAFSYLPPKPGLSNHNFFTPEAEQAAEGDPDAFYRASHQGFTSQAPGYAAQATYQTIEHQTIPSLPYSTGGYVPPEPAYSPPQPHNWRPFPLYSQPSPTTAYSTSPPTTNFQAYDYIEGHLQVPESGQPTSGSSRSGSPNSTDLHNYGYPNHDGTWTCKYPGCSSKSVFSRGCDLRKHFNRHTNSLFCRHEGCPQAKEGGFSSKKDRARYEAKHNPGIVCEWDGCNRVFSRMDNMKDHVRRVHRASSPFYSPYYATPAVITYPTPTPRPTTVGHRKDPPTPMRKLILAKALQDFKQEEGADEELPFKQGDIIEVLEKSASLVEEGRCRARLMDSGRIGLVPFEYLEELSLAAQEAFLAQLLSPYVPEIAKATSIVTSAFRRDDGLETVEDLLLEWTTMTRGTLHQLHFEAGIAEDVVIC